MRRTIAVAGLMVFLFAACGGGNRGPDRTVRRFFSALNDRDVNQMLSCVDPRQERLLRATFRLVEKATGLPVDEILEMLPGLHQAFGSHMREDFRFTNVRVRSRDVSRDSARLTVSVKSSYRTGGLVTTRLEHFEFMLEKFEEAGWRIVSVAVVQSDESGSS
ncbi:MAG TPA: hypothetical protein VHL59_14110 [Thermoanaerobaculia bacterium]|nr:hypothetical protein [Thermoanaerobaculia bacterium]